MKIEFKNSILRLGFLYRIADIKNAWINPCSKGYFSTGKIKFPFTKYFSDTTVNQIVNKCLKLSRLCNSLCSAPHKK